MSRQINTSSPYKNGDISEYIPLETFPLTIAISRDGLKTFTDYFDIETAPDHAFTNPTVTVTSDGLYVLNYWALKYTEDWKMIGLIDLKVATFRLKI